MRNNRTAIAGLLTLSLALAVPHVPAQAASADQPARLSGADPFADCTADDTPGETYTPGTESEPTIAVHPKNPRVMAVAWRQDLWATGSSRGIVVASTKNGGATWSTRVLPGVSACSGGEGRVTNPWIHFAADGTLHASVTVFGGDRTIIAAGRSADGGLTWSAPIELAGDPMPRFFADKQTITSDPRAPRRLYMVWNRRDREQDVHDLMFAQSGDGGRTWSPARSIYRPATQGAGTIGSQLAVLPDGGLAVVFVENDHPIGGAPWPPDIPEQVRAIRSDDRGATWSDPVTIAGYTAAQPLLPDTPWVPLIAPGTVADIAVDQRSGGLYAVWADATLSTSLSAIALSYSADGGRTWSAPRKINLTPDSPAFGAGQAFLPQVEVAGDGTVGVSYHDFRGNAADPEATTDIWLATCKGKRCSAPGAAWRERHLAGPFDINRAPHWFGGPYVGSYIPLAHTRSGFTLAPVMTSADAGDATDVYFVSSSLERVTSAAAETSPADITTR
ncbi:sialidase family protein [Nonomuraea fastidiosa]|uniref:sialidase family protein n=1 Tax=Nonomuraea TaxID=83681 RepID=UPI0034293A78